MEDSGNVDKPKLSRTRNTWLGRFSVWLDRIFSSKTDRSKNLQDFRNAVSYLNNKYGDKIPDLRTKLTEKLAHYQSNRRGIDGQGGRRRVFTEQDLKKLEDEAKKEKFRKELLAGIGNTQLRTSAQREYIVQYCENMVANGNKIEYAIEVGKAMNMLYAEGIESVLPQKPINIHKIAYNADGAEMRGAVTDKLRTIMSRHGADYRIMESYFEQQKQDSWNPLSLCMKYFYLQQRADPEQISEQYYLATYSQEELGAAFNEWYPSEGDKKKYAKTVSMYQAFTAITLARLSFEDPSPVSQENRTITLHRGVNSVNANSRKQGIADSTSLGEVDPKFSRDGMTVLEFTVPFCDVHALYFMSPELCDSSGSYASEREVICDMSNAKIEILT